MTDKASVTSYIALIAAGVSAIVAICIAVYTAKRAIRSEERTATRTLLTGPVTEFFALAHEAGSSAAIAVRRLEAGKSPRKWIRKSCAACEKLKKNRLRLLIAVGPLDEGIRTLSRLGNWLACKASMSDAELALQDSRQLVDSANRLKGILEEELRRLPMSGQWLDGEVHPECRNAVVNMELAWRQNASRTPAEDDDSGDA